MVLKNAPPKRPPHRPRPVQYAVPPSGGAEPPCSLCGSFARRHEPRSVSLSFSLDGRSWVYFAIRPVLIFLGSVDARGVTDFRVVVVELAGSSARAPLPAHSCAPLALLALGSPRGMRLPALEAEASGPAGLHPDELDPTRLDASGRLETRSAKFRWGHCAWAHDGGVCLWGGSPGVDNREVFMIGRGGERRAARHAGAPRGPRSRARVSGSARLTSRLRAFSFLPFPPTTTTTTPRSIAEGTPPGGPERPGGPGRSGGPAAPTRAPPSSRVRPVRPTLPPLTNKTKSTPRPLSFLSAQARSAASVGSPRASARRGASRTRASPSRAAPPSRTSSSAVSASRNPRRDPRPRPTPPHSCHRHPRHSCARARP